MALIGIVIDDMFEDIEYTAPAKAFKDAGHSLTHIGLKKDHIVKGKRKRIPVKIDQSISNVDIDSIDAILIPGGYSPIIFVVIQQLLNLLKIISQLKNPYLPFVMHYRY